MDALPGDVLRAVLALVAPSPRLHVLSLVCRRWRREVLRSFAALPPLAPLAPRLPELVPLFPALVDLHLLGPRPGPDGRPCACLAYTALTGVRTLTVTLDSVACDCVSTVLERSAATLEDLRLDSLWCASPRGSADRRLSVALASACLPRLTHLAMQRVGPAMREGAAALLCRHAAQLTELALRAGAETVAQGVLAPPAGHAAPTLARLERCVVQNATANLVARHAPALRAVDFEWALVADGLHVELERRLFALLTSYARPAATPTRPTMSGQSRALLAAAPRVTALSFLLPEASAHWLPHADRLTRLALLAAPGTPLAALELCTRLDALALHCSALPAPPSFRLAPVRSLALLPLDEPAPLSDLTAWLRAARAALPALTAVSLAAAAAPPAQWRELFELLHGAGVSQVRLHAPASEAAAIRSESRRYPWLGVLVG